METGYENHILYHYTDYQALDGMLHHAQLRVNNVLNMNDAAEMRYFMDGLCDAVAKRLESEGDIQRAERVRELFQEELKKEFYYSAYAACFLPPPGRRGPVGAVREPGQGRVHRLPGQASGEDGHRGIVLADRVLPGRHGRP